MFTDKDVENVKVDIEHLKEDLQPILEDLTIRIKDYKPEWIYAHSRRVTEYEKILETMEYLISLPPWLMSQGLVNIDVKSGFAPLLEVKVIDPGTGDKFSFYNVKTEKELKNIQKLGYEILEKIR